MIKRILTAVALTLSVLNPLRAEDLRSLFVHMPDSILPTLTASERLDFMDFMDAGMKAQVRNKLGGESVMTAFTDNYLSIRTSGSGRMEMILFPYKNNGRNLICIIKTVTARYEDSRLYFYNEDWSPVRTESVIKLPEFRDYLTREALKNDTLDIFMKRSLLRLQSVTSVDGGLEFRYTSLDYIGVDAEKYRSWIRVAPIRYVWNGKCFKRK